VYKATADVEFGKKMFGFYSDVNDSHEPHFLSLRSIVLDRKLPRRMFVQQHTYIEGLKHFCFCSFRDLGQMLYCND
jgi:dipeptidyl-peptidase-3